MDNPMSPRGALHWGLLGLAGALVALTVSVFAPSVIPSSATRVAL